MELLLVEKNGWTKPVRIERAITLLGSGVDSDIQLVSTGTEFIQIQILYTPENPIRCNVVNLGIPIQIRENQNLSPLQVFNSIELHDGDEIFIGDYIVSIKLEPNTPNRPSPIQAEVHFNEFTLTPGFGLTGYFTFINAGHESSCQFQVEVYGLSADCYQIDPVPLLFAGAREEVRIRIFHRGDTPLAGNRIVRFRITAPESYPNEECLISQPIYVTPVFHHTLTIIDDTQVHTNQNMLQRFSTEIMIENSKQEEITIEPKNILGTETPSGSGTIPPEADSRIGFDSSVDEEIPIQNQAASTTIKVMQNHSNSDTFWDGAA